MSRFGLVGGTYQSLSPNLDAQFTMNWYPEPDETQNGRSAAALYPTPGLSPFATLPNAFSVLGMLEFQGILYACGQISPTAFKMWQVNANGTIGLSTGNLPIYNGLNGIASMIGSPASANLSLGVPTISVCAGGQISVVRLDTFVTAVQNQSTYLWAEYLDGFICALVQGNQFQIFGPNDPTNYSALNLATVSVMADNFTAMIATDRLLVFFSEKQGVPYYNSGALFPFIPVPGVLLDQGCIATKSPVRADNTIFWIGGDARGAGVAYRASGTTPQRISTFPVETAWRSYSTITDAFGYSYQENGHTFIVWNFPTANATWVYDVATQSWHQRGRWNGTTGQFGRQLGQCHAYCYGQHFVGDYNSGDIYMQSLSVLTDNGNPIRRVRRAPVIAVEHEWMFHNSLEVLTETGLPSNIAAASTSPTAYYVPDQQGNTWAVTVLDNGEYHIAGPVTNAAQTLIVGDNTVLGQNWQIIVTLNAANQNVLATLEVFQNGPLSFPIATNPSLLQSAIYVAGGQVQTAQGLSVTRQPMLDMRFSDDGGHTWSNYKPKGLGFTGNYRKRLKWYRLGRSRNRIYEIACSDLYSTRIIDGFIDADPEMKPTQRLNDRLRAMA